MQTHREIRQLLSAAGHRPNRRLGQCFMTDLNLLQAVVEAAELTGEETVLEVGPGTGSLTEELLDRAGRVVSVECDPVLAGIVKDRLAGRENLTLLQRDALAGKHAIAPEALAALGERAVLVSNLPYAIATPLVTEAMIESWRSLQDPAVRFDRMAFTVQKEVADRFAATSGSDYGPASVVLHILGAVRIVRSLPSSAFWPRPKIDSGIVRVDFQPQRAADLASIDTLQALLHLAFTQRRKHIATVVKARNAPFEPTRFAAALQAVGIDESARAEAVSPEEFRELANRLDRTNG